MGNRILYILCHDDVTEQRATSEFKDYKWARVYRIKEQNQLLESVFYINELLSLYHEWKDCDFVGTLSYKFFYRCNFYINNNKSLTRIIEQIEKTSINDYDVVSFMTFKGGMWDQLPYLEKILYDTVDRCNMNLKRYNTMKRKFQYVIRPFESMFFFHNYWMCTPNMMLKYIDFFKNKWTPVLEQHPLVWTHCPYNGAVAKERHLQLTNGRVDHYTYHAYVNELLPAVFFTHMNSRIQYI